MGEAGDLYEVLLPGIKQRVGDGWRSPAVGARINISAKGAAPLLKRGFVKLAQPEAKVKATKPAKHAPEIDVDLDDEGKVS